MNSNKPRFDKINKYNVAIKSLRNKLRHAEGIEELADIADQIVHFENQILIEKSQGYKKLEDEKKIIERKIDKMQRDLEQATNELQRIGNSLDFKLNGYKKKLQEKLQSLKCEYNYISEFIEKK
jgi:hypothetical protein